MDYGKQKAQRTTSVYKQTNSTKGSFVQWIQEFDNDEVANNVVHIVEPGNEQNLDRLVLDVCGT